MCQALGIQRQAKIVEISTNKVLIEKIDLNQRITQQRSMGKTGGPDIENSEKNF